jgi:tRNA-specific adenosine deaminase 1
VDTGRKNLPHLARSKTGLYETVINGVKQGNRASSPGKRGASALSRAKLWALFRDISSTVSFHTDRNSASVTEPRLDTVQPGEVHGGTSQRTESGIAIYQGLKHPIDSKDPLHIRMQAIKDAKQVLKGWMPNSGDENWGLDVLVDQKKRKRDIPKAVT